jgi:hypothetical protein
VKPGLLSCHLWTPPLIVSWQLPSILNLMIQYIEVQYIKALLQLRLHIHNGGIGLTSAALGTCSFLFIALAQLAFNSFCQHGPEALHYQWVIAGKLAQRICPMPSFDLPDSATTHGQEANHSKQLESFQHFMFETVLAVGPRGHHCCL